MAGKTFMAFPAHAQPAILGIWQEVHVGFDCSPMPLFQWPLNVSFTGIDISFADIEDFLYEATITRGLDHPNVLKIIGVSIDRRDCHVVLPFMEKGNLREVLLDTQNVSFCLSLPGNILLKYDKLISGGIKITLPLKIIGRFHEIANERFRQALKITYHIVMDAVGCPCPNINGDSAEFLKKICLCRRIGKWRTLIIFEHVSNNLARWEVFWTGHWLVLRMR